MPSKSDICVLPPPVRTKYPFRRIGHQGQQHDAAEPAAAGSSQLTAIQHVEKVDTYLNETSLSRRHHPAADRGMPPPSLAPYHQCVTDFHDLQFDNTMIANGMRAFNSVDGVSPEAWFLLITCQTYCMGCGKVFSHDGYSAHISANDHCPMMNSSWYYAEVTNHLLLEHYNLTQLRAAGLHHPANCSDEPPSALRQYHPDFIPSNSPPPIDLFRTTAVGRALLEWNSSIGISMDTWKTVATAYVHCGGCNRFRSFDGDCLHRDVNGVPFCGAGRVLGLDESAEEPVYFESTNKAKGKGKAREYIYVSD
ncbi:hypothetical protein HWV62_700 [Athelia sp. TMB]|nr:hypothetical protein HWV62_700 [Athelia sp. TMB]